MKYSIDLQSPFSFSPYWYAVGVALIVFALLLRFGFNRIFAVKLDSPFRIDKLRRDCLRQVGKIEQAYNNKEIDSRSAHQQMSQEIRRFVHDVTGLETGTMVLEDLSRLGRPELAELIREYYEPMFARASFVDAGASLEKGKALVDKVYGRAIREQRIRRTAERQSSVNRFLNKAARVTPRFLRKFLVLPKINHNSLTWMERIQLAFEAGDLDPHSTVENMNRAVRDPHSTVENMNRAVRSFVYAVTGAGDEEEALAKARETALRNSAPGIARTIRKCYDPVSPDCSHEEARRMINKGKELIKDECKFS